MNGAFDVTHEWRQRRTARDIPDSDQSVIATTDDGPQGRIDRYATNAALMPNVIDAFDTFGTVFQLARGKDPHMAVAKT